MVKEYKNAVDNSPNSADDTSKIREDINALADRVGKLKNHSYEAFQEVMSNWGNAVQKYKDKAIDQGADGVESVANYVRRNPWQCVVGTALAVFVLTKLTSNK